MTKTVSSAPSSSENSPVRPMAEHMRSAARLAGPVALSRFGFLLLVITDTAMLGHVSSVEMAYYALANAIYMIFLLVGTGMLVGTAVLTSQALGAAQDKQAGAIWRTALWHAFFLGLGMALLALLAPVIFRLTGQGEDLAQGATRTLFYLAAGLPGMLSFVACTVFLESLNRPTPGFIAILLANITNLLLNWLVLAAPLGFLEGMDAEAVAATTSILRSLIAVGLILYILRLRDAARLGLDAPVWRLRGTAEHGRRLRRLGYALGAAQGLESLAFSSLMITAGLIGTHAVAAYQIVINIFATVFMVAVGTSMATVVGVGRAAGGGSSRDAARAGWSGVLLIIMFMACAALVLLLFRGQIAGLQSNDQLVLALAVPALFFASFAFIPDGMQTVLMGALRGAGDVWMPTFLHVFAFVFVMMPAAPLFAIYFDLGVTGLVLAAMSGVTVATILLGTRFYVFSRRKISRL